MISWLGVVVLVFSLGAAVSMARRTVARDLGTGPTPRPARPTSRSWGTPDSGAGRPGRTSVAERIGRGLSFVTGQSPAHTRDRRTGRCILLAGTMFFVQPALGTGLVIVLGSASVGRRRRKARERSQRIAHGLADAIDLLAVSLLSGDTVQMATAQIGRWVEGEIGEAFDRCHRQVEQGQTLADALEAVPDRLGPAARPLATALVAAERYGAPIGANLIQLAADSRADRRRRFEASARRLPVILLFPLVVCVLPAFLLVTVVPVVAQTVAAFDLDASPEPP